MRCICYRFLLSSLPPSRRHISMARSAHPRTVVPDVSNRVRSTDEPCIVKTKQMMASASRDVLSLAQGIVHWEPPLKALTAAAAAASDPRSHAYGPADGLPELRSALEVKLVTENDLPNYAVMVTAGANQAFTNLVLTLTDADDKVVLFRPYYFNHLMALQMTGGSRHVLYGACRSDTLHPDLDWLERELRGPDRPKMVVITNPCNPTGVLMTKEEVNRAADLCHQFGAWFVLDNTYEHFVYNDSKKDDSAPPRAHYCASGPHVLHIFSFSKAFGMMGWRVGYIAYPKPSLGAAPQLGSEILKVQDTIPICASTASQFVALGAIQAGRSWVENKVKSLGASRDVVLGALAPLQPFGIYGGEGAIYVWAKLPPQYGSDSTAADDSSAMKADEAVVEWLIQRHGVCVIAGSSCGCPGYIRVAYANLEEALIREAAGRLRAGLEELVRDGMIQSFRSPEEESS